MDSPNPDPGEEYPHTNTQLFNVLDPSTGSRTPPRWCPPYNAHLTAGAPTMDGFVTDYISFLTVELGRQPLYDEYRQIMTGYTPDQVPVLSALARRFGVFDHWFSEVPSQTLANRSFWTAATSSGFVVNRPMTNFMRHNRAETIFERLERTAGAGRSTSSSPIRFLHRHDPHGARSGTASPPTSCPSPSSSATPAAGTCPDFSLIEPNLLAGHCDYHPAFGRALLPGVDVLMDPPSSILAGEAFLGRIYDAVRSAAAPTGSNAFNTVLFVGFDEPGGTYDHVPPGPVPPPSRRPPGQLGFASIAPATASRRSSSRPGSPGAVCTDEYRHTSLLATLPRGVGPRRALHRPGCSGSHLRGCLRPGHRGHPDLAGRHTVGGSALSGAAGGGPPGAGDTGTPPLPRAVRSRPPRQGPSRPSQSDPDVSPALAIDFALHLGSRLFPKLAPTFPGTLSRRENSDVRVRLPASEEPWRPVGRPRTNRGRYPQWTVQRLKRAPIEQVSR